MDYRESFNDNCVGQEQDYIAGTVTSVIYRNEETGYSVIKIDTSDVGEEVTVVGCIPFAFPGQDINAEGIWEKNANYGLQFKAQTADILLPRNSEALQRYLACGAIKGIGPATAGILVDRFGAETLNVISDNPDMLAEIKGISISKARAIHKEYEKQAVINKLSEYISIYGLRPVLAVRMYRFFGLDAAQILEDNPYILASAQIGGKFAEADRLALDMGFDGDSQNRIKAGIVYELNYNLSNGHCFIPKEKLIAAASGLIKVGEDDVSACLDELLNEGEIVFQHVAGCDACYLPKMFDAEVNCAERFSVMSAEKTEYRADIESILSYIEKRENITYTALQRSTLHAAAENQLLVITGGPGTGKTTVIKAICALFDKLGLDVLLTAPTGRAAKRMSEVTGLDASTIHRMLGAKISEDGENVLFDKNESEPLECDAVILDECSMVDIQLMSALLYALPVKAKLILVGDADQLPSVGPGNVFSAIIRSNAAEVIVLNEIFRQGTGSSIVKNAHDINAGVHPDFSDNSGDFFRLKRMNASTTVETIVELMTKRIPQNMKISADDIQILSCTRKGELGTVNLNRCIQNEINPAKSGKKEKIFGEQVYRVGDKVMQIKNNYDMIWVNTMSGISGAGIYNGDIGSILDIDFDSGALVIDFDGKFVKYSFDFLAELDHAWAVTVHKSQGSEYSAVILALSDHSSLLLQRDILYTAVTRAKKMFVMVGDENIAHRMIDNYKQSRRYCALRYRIVEICGKN